MWFKIYFVLHITKYTKLRIRTEDFKHFLKKYVKRRFCIQAIRIYLANVYSIFSISMHRI